MREHFSIFHHSESSSSSASFKPFFQPKLSINQPNDVYKNEADAVAENVMATNYTSPKKTFFASSTVPQIQKQDDAKTPEAKPDEKKPEEKKDDVKIGFIDTGSLIKAFKDLIIKLPANYQQAYKKYTETHEGFTFDLDESRKLASKEIMAFWNFSWALAYKQMQPYKEVTLSDSIKMAEQLSGYSDTYINLASLILQKDMDKYISDEVPSLLKKNLGIIILTGLLLQGGYSAINYAVNKELNALNVFSPLLTSFTDPPDRFKSATQLDNPFDPRWKYPFLQPSTDLQLDYSKYRTDGQQPQFNLNLGFNLASALDLYPKKDEDKKKYKGFELYPFLNINKLYNKEGDAPLEKTDKYFAGLFIGNKGFYTLMEGGAIKGPTGLVEGYGRLGFMFRNLDHLNLAQVDVEEDYRPGTPGLRTRISGAAEISFIDNANWQLLAGGSVNGLLPSASSGGAVDLGLTAKLYAKHDMPGYLGKGKTGLEFDYMRRHQDPFDASSAELTTWRAKIVFSDVFRLGVQGDSVSGRGGVNVFAPIAGDANLPANNLTVFGSVDIAPLLFRDKKK